MITSLKIALFINKLLDLSNFKFFRKLLYGKWYHYEMSGELPSCYGDFWTQTEINHRYVNLLKIEEYK